MSRYLMTHSLLSAWLYTMQEEREDADTDEPNQERQDKSNDMGQAFPESKAMREFVRVLRREPAEPNIYMQRGIDFENLVTDILSGNADPDSRWFNAAAQIADIVHSGLLQYKVSKEVRIGGETLLLYGRLDVLKAGVVYDIKYTGKYERGKFFSNTQHPMYLELIPEARRFIYLISDGKNVWTERYERKETESIFPVIEQFLDWLEMMGLTEIYHQYWLSK